MSVEVRPISRRVLARHAARTMPAQAACAGRSRLWDQLENDAPWAGATHVTATIAGALERIAPLCSRCPIRGECAAWAGVERYSGYAAGRLYVDGRPLGTGDRST